MNRTNFADPVTSSSPSGSSNVQCLHIYATITIGSLCEHADAFCLHGCFQLSRKSWKKSRNTQSVEEILSCTSTPPFRHPLFFHGPLLSASWRHYLHLKLGFYSQCRNFAPDKRIHCLALSLQDAKRGVCIMSPEISLSQEKKVKAGKRPTPLPLSSCRDSHSNVNTQIFLTTRILYSPLPCLFLLSW